MIRVLHVIGNMERAGAQSFIMNLYRNIDRNCIQFDFIVHSIEESDFCKEIEALGGRVYLISRKNKNIFRNLYEIYKITKKNKYTIIQRHTNNTLVFIDLLAARIGGAKVLIPHSHSVNSQWNTLNKIFKPFLNLLATSRFACSEEAGKWLYGNAKYEIIKNGIDIDKFKFVLNDRNELRSKFQIDKADIVIGHIGRFHEAKNHIFLLEVFHELNKKHGRYKLLLVGDGENRNSIIEKIKELNLKEEVIFSGIVNDVNRYLSMMDAFIFPSLYEGLPVTLIEAQASGVQCFISDNITKEVEVSDLIYYIPLKESASKWAEFINQNLDTNINRNNIDNDAFRFDIKKIAEDLKSFYVNKNQRNILGE